VAQIGRRIAERLTADEERLRKARGLGGIDPDVVETAALVHDLGHPPYGHAVEQELDHLVSIKHGVHDGYEGNAQSFRIVTKLAMRHRRFPGLNLTRASLNASLKYPWFRAGRGEDERKHNKWGVYKTEHRKFEWARKSHRGRINKSSSLRSLVIEDKRPNMIPPPFSLESRPIRLPNFTPFPAVHCGFPFPLLQDECPGSTRTCGPWL
jgi:dGTP triphosphohydrolase